MIVTVDDASAMCPRSIGDIWVRSLLLSYRNHALNSSQLFRCSPVPFPSDRRRRRRRLEKCSHSTQPSPMCPRACLGDASPTVRLRSRCTIFCKRVYARATFRHTDPLGCVHRKVTFQLKACFCVHGFACVNALLFACSRSD